MRVTKKYLKDDIAVIVAERFHAYSEMFAIFDCFLAIRSRDGVRGPLHRIDRHYWGYTPSPSWPLHYHTQCTVNITRPHYMQKPPFTTSMPFHHEGIYHLHDLPYQFIDLMHLVSMNGSEDLRRIIIRMKVNPLSACIYMIDISGNVHMCDTPNFNSRRQSR